MKSIQDIIKQIVIENNMEDEFIFSRITDVWKNKFHPTIQKNIHLIKFKNKILYLKTDSSAWKKEFSLREKTIIEQFNSNLKENLINKLII